MTAQGFDRWEICARFEAAWGEHERGNGLAPRAEEFVPETEAGEAATRLLVALLRADAFHRTRLGLEVSLIDDLPRFPFLAQGCPSACREEVLALFAADFDRKKAGPGAPPSPAEYLRRVPDAYANDLEPRLRPALRTTHELAALIGAGAMGEVHAAFDRELGRKVAVKRIRPEWAEDEQALRAFRNEAAITAALEHPAILPVYRLIVDDEGRPGYVMRLVERGPNGAPANLSAAIAAFHAAPQRDFRGRAFRRLLGHFLAACDAVAYAHSEGVVHRDLKPDNVLVGRFGETFVTDWGLAARVGEEAPEAPVSGSCGTPAYMSPEQARGEAAHDPRGDIYGLGAILFQVLTGRPPHTGGTPEEVLDGLRRGVRAKVLEVEPRVPRALALICERALAPNVEGRYPDAEALRADVERWLAGERVDADAREPWHEGAGRWVRKHQAVAAAAVLGAAVLLGSWLREANAAGGPAPQSFAPVQVAHR
jgi:hypothetical protein